MEVGRNFRPSSFVLVLSTIQGVILVPHAWFVAVTNWNVSRAPDPWPESRMPRLFCLPSSPPSPLNHPKKTPLEPDDAVIANVPEALRCSCNVLAEIRSAYEAVFEARQTVPPISPAPLPA